jgi:large subunit ribosomal protein L29
MKFADLKDLAETELLKKQKALAGDLFELKMKNELGQLGNPLKIRSLRRELARVKTALAAKRK